MVPVKAKYLQTCRMQLENSIFFSSSPSRSVDQLEKYAGPIIFPAECYDSTDPNPGLERGPASATAGCLELYCRVAKTPVLHYPSMILSRDVPVTYVVGEGE